MNFKIEVDEEDYQLVGPGGEESGVVDYGEVATVEVGGVSYFTALVDEEDAEAAVIYCLKDGKPEAVIGDHTVEETEFELETTEEEDEEEDAGEGDED